MSKIVIYKNGERYYQDQHIAMGIHRGEVVEEIDLFLATRTELETLKKNPNNDTVLNAVKQRSLQ